MKIILCCVAIVLLSSHSMAQKYPWPVGTAPALTANFGELRANHYHMGLDARTERRENLPVFSIDNGYIARVKIEPWGYGRAIYINHPDGNTSVYAHLNDFFPELENWITEQQYLRQSWELDIEVPQGLFPVNKKQLIAYSGNTGGSMGPHLHFELRNTESEIVLNPLLYGFSVQDNIAPDIIRLAIYDRSKSTYEQSPRYIALKRTGNTYTAPVVVVHTSKVSFGITSYDRYTGSTNQNGIYKASMSVNNKKEIYFIMDSIYYPYTRYLNAHIDYKTKLAGGPYIQHLSRLPGYQQSIYYGNDGIVELDEIEKEILIKVSDPVGNTATLKFKIKTTAKENKELQIKEPAFYPGQVNIFENEEVRFYLNEYSVYDAFSFNYKKLNTAEGVVHQLHNGLVPVHEYFTVHIKNNTIPDTSKVVMHYYYGTKKRYAKASENNGWYSARFRELGNYLLIYDTVPPVISTIQNSATSISFTITDNTEDLKNFKATLNGKWIRFSYDKGKYFVYKKDKRVLKGENVLWIEVEDMCGNKATKKFVFNG